MQNSRFGQKLILSVLTCVLPAHFLAAQDYFRHFDNRSRTEAATPVIVPEEVPYETFDAYEADAADAADTLPPPEYDDSIYPAPETAAIPPLPSEPEERYNLKLGPVLFNVALGVGLEFNDNVSLSPPGDEESDLIFRPSVTVDAIWPITRLNTLRFTVGASYAKYFDNSQYDSRSLLLSPSSALQLTIHVGEVVFTVYDRFSYQEDPFDLPVLAGVATYRRFENAIGIQADWDINPVLRLTTGYEHYNLWTFDNEFDVLDRSVDTFYFRPQYALSPAINVGVNTMVSFINYSSDFHNDGTSYIIAPFIDAQLTRNTRFFLEAGVQIFDFDTGGIVADDEDTTGLYAKFEISNILTENYRHRLRGSKTTETGFTTNSYDLYHIEYSADWSVLPSVVVSPTLFYEHFDTSGEGGEEGDRYGAALGLRYIFTPSITMGLDYRYVYRDSNLEDANYRQNLVLLTLFYNF